MKLSEIEIVRERPSGGPVHGAVYLGDAVALLPGLLERYEGQAQLIYIDPPFLSGEVYHVRTRVGERDWRTGRGTLTQTAFDDRYELNEYLSMMRQALTGARRLLSETGVIFVHIDSRMHAHLRLMMDEIFGEPNFLNEIIWTYQTGGRARRFYSRKHDVILFYRKSRKYYFNLEAVPVSRAEHRRNHMKRNVDADGRTYRSIKSGGKIYTYYDDAPAYPGDVWDDVSHLQQKDPQRTGYDTQKPGRLLDRIILCGSKPNDLVCDLFAGSGTTLESAHANGRRFLGVDLSPLAFQAIRRRLESADVEYFAMPCAGRPTVEADLTPAIAYYEVELKKFQIEVGLCARSFSGMDALDSWSVGYVRDGAFVCFAQEARTRRNPALRGLLQLPVLAGRPCIRVCDVLGRYFFYMMEGEGAGVEPFAQ